MLKSLVALLFTVFTLSGYTQKEYKSLFWEITGNGLTEPSYIYGTMHTQDNRVFDFKKGVMEAFQSCKIYAMELNMDSINQMELMNSLIMDSAYSLNTLLSKSDYKIVEAFFRDSLRQPLFMFNKMQPMFTSQMVSMKDLQADQHDALDLYFFKEAKKQNKKTIGLETMKEQVDAFSSIPYEKQAEGLVKAVKEYGKEDKNSISEIMEFYVQGDLDKLLEISTEYGEEGDFSEQFNQIFLTNRNYNMTERAIPYISTGSTFIAVGAAHLPGEEGIVELLRKKGYTVTAK